jgi:hypothetical protein
MTKWNVFCALAKSQSAPFNVNSTQINKVPCGSRFALQRVDCKINLNSVTYCAIAYMSIHISFLEFTHTTTFASTKSPQIDPILTAINGLNTHNSLYCRCFSSKNSTTVVRIYQASKYMHHLLQANYQNCIITDLTVTEQQYVWTVIPSYCSKNTNVILKNNLVKHHCSWRDLNDGKEATVSKIMFADHKKNNSDFPIVLRSTTIVLCILSLYFVVL